MTGKDLAIRATLALALVGTGVVVGLVVPGRDKAPVADATNVTEVPHVVVRALERREIAQTITAYGSVTAAPAHSHTVNVAFEGVVRRILVMPGQLVEAGAALVEIASSPDTKLAAADARSELAAAERELVVVEEKVSLGLATRIDLNQAKLRVSNARSKLASQAGRGGPGGLVLKAQRAGVVSQVFVATGQIVSSGSALLELVDQDSLEMVVGVEPEDTSLIEPEQAVEIESVSGPFRGGVPGTVVGVAQRVNPTTRLVDVTVRARPGPRLLLNEFVRAGIVVRSASAIVAPRTALLPSAGGYQVMLVEEGKVVLREVELGIENDGNVELRGEGLEAGTMAVVAGATGLVDGTAVVTELAP